MSTDADFFNAEFRESGAYFFSVKVLSILRKMQKQIVECGMKIAGDFLPGGVILGSFFG
jgi:hypothetical protein